jgi:hypothetical protein
MPMQSCENLARIDGIRVKRALVAAVEVDEAESASIKP